MRRPALIVACAMLACGSEPPPPPEHEVMLEQLQVMEKRLLELEVRAQQAPTAPPAATDDASPGIGKLAVDVTQERAPATERTLSVEVTATGYIVEGETLEADAMEERLDAAAQEHADASLLVRSAPGVPHEKIVALLEMAKKRGIDKLAIASLSE